jgi:hypothetical protein
MNAVADWIAPVGAASTSLRYHNRLDNLVHAPEMPIMKNSPLTIAAGLVLTITLVFLLAGCGRSIQESKVVGSWQVYLNPKRAIIYTYRKDHSWTLTVTGRKFSEDTAVIGDWRLNGDQLVTVMRAVTNNNLAEIFSIAMFNNATNRIVELSDSVMIWRNEGQWRGFKLKRINPSPSAGE